jgi:hypothetical protein
MGKVVCFRGVQLTLCELWNELVGPSGDLRLWTAQEVRGERWDEPTIEAVRDPFEFLSRAASSARVPAKSWSCEQTPESYLPHPSWLAASRMSCYPSELGRVTRRALRRVSRGAPCSKVASSWLGGIIEEYWKQVNADYYRVAYSQLGTALVCVCDGAGYGNRPAAAARDASEGFLRYMTFALRPGEEMGRAEIASVLYSALQCAHATARNRRPWIGKGKSLTTLLGGVLLPLSKRGEEGHSHLMTVVSHGDCVMLVGRFFPAEGWKVEDCCMTREPEDLFFDDRYICPGGLIGGLKGPKNSLSSSWYCNPKIGKFLLKPGDLVILGTDGLGDNLSPEDMNFLLSHLPRRDPRTVQETFLKALRRYPTKPDHVTCLVLRVD